jgi:Flp pilus assembly pilin Flp
MHRIKTIARSFLRDEDGIAVTEYGILLALLALVLILAVASFGTEFQAWWGSNVEGVLSNSAFGP